MQILIDGERIEFTLETEKNAARVTESIEAWLASQNTYMTQLKIDGEVFDYTDLLPLEKKSVDSIETLEVETAPLAGIELENGLEVLAYLTRYIDLARKRDPETVSQVGIDGLGWVMTSIRLAAGLNMINLLAFPSADSSLFQDFVILETKLQQLAKLAGLDTQLDFFSAEILPNLELIMQTVQDFYRFIAKRKDRSFDPLARAEVCRTEIEGLKEKLGELSTDLQTGNELKAMQAIQETTLHLDNLFSFITVVKDRHGVDTAGVLVDGVSLEAWTARLTEIGNEIIAAFKNEDSILLGDLFEYEISVELEKAPGYIAAITDMLAAGTAS